MGQVGEVYVDVVEEEVGEVHVYVYVYVHEY